MSAIVTEKFRLHNATQFFESFTEASSSTYYLFIGKSSPFTSTTTTGSDSSPPTPADAVGETEFYAWDSMLYKETYIIRCNSCNRKKKLGQMVQLMICMTIM